MSNNIYFSLTVVGNENNVPCRHILLVIIFFYYYYIAIMRCRLITESRLQTGIQHGLIARETRRVSLVKQELPTIPEHMNSTPVLVGSLVFCVLFCRSLFVFFLLVIVLSVLLRFLASDCAFCIFVSIFLLTDNRIQTGILHDLKNNFNYLSNSISCKQIICATKF